MFSDVFLLVPLRTNPRGPPLNTIKTAKTAATRGANHLYVLAWISRDYRGVFVSRGTVFVFWTRIWQYRNICCTEHVGHLAEHCLYYRVMLYMRCGNLLNYEQTPLQYREHLLLYPEQLLYSGDEFGIVGNLRCATGFQLLHYWEQCL